MGPETRIACVIKANAYGHGDVLVGQLCEKFGASVICVNSLYEAYRIRDSGVDLPIIILGYIPQARLKAAVRLPNSVFGLHSFEQLNCLKSMGEEEVRVHLKIDSGLKRVGFVLEDLEELTQSLRLHAGWLKVEGIFTHLARVEYPEDPIYLHQKRIFDNALEFLRKKGLNPETKHFQKSGSSLFVEDLRNNNLARVGITLYGLWPCETTRKNYLKLSGDESSLKPLLSIQTSVQSVYRSKGEWIGLLPLGHNDQVSSLKEVWIQGKSYPISAEFMNYSEVLLGTEQFRVGEPVLVLGETNSAQRLADWSQTINYEVTTRINRPMFYQVGENEYHSEVFETQKYKFQTEFNATLEYSRSRLRGLFQKMHEASLKSPQTPGKTRHIIRLNNPAVIFRDHAVTREILQISEKQQVIVEHLLCSEISEAKELNRLYPQKQVILDSVISFEEDELKSINQKSFTVVMQTLEQAQTILALKKINFQIYLKVKNTTIQYILGSLSEQEKNILASKLRGLVFQSTEDLDQLGYIEQNFQLNHETDIILLDQQQSLIAGEYQILAKTKYSSQIVDSLNLSVFEEQSSAVNFTSVIAQKKFVKKGEKIGYDWTYEMKRDGYIAVVPVGYFDGLSRRHSNNGVAIIDGVRCPLVGKVYMNFSSYDITDHPNLAQIASEHQVILTGVSTNGEKIAQKEFALTPMEKNFSSINFRLPRVIVD